MAASMNKTTHHSPIIEARVTGEGKACDISRYFYVFVTLRYVRILFYYHAEGSHTLLMPQGSHALSQSISAEEHDEFMHNVPP